jgi:hypothetical protein
MMTKSALGGPGPLIKKPRNLKETGNDTFDSTAAPRVGGAAPKSTTVYSGKGALPGAKKLKKAPVKSVKVKRTRKY